MSLGEGIAWCPQPIDDAQIYGSAAIISLLPFYTFSFRYGKYCDILLVARRGSGNLSDWTREGFRGFVETFYLGVEWGFTSLWDFTDPEIGDFLKGERLGELNIFVYGWEETSWALSSWWRLRTLVMGKACLFWLEAFCTIALLATLTDRAKAGPRGEYCSWDGCEGDINPKIIAMNYYFVALNVLLTAMMKTMRWQDMLLLTPGTGNSRMPSPLHSQNQRQKT